jgi:hypothetical protein
VPKFLAGKGSSPLIIRRTPLTCLQPTFGCFRTQECAEREEYIGRSGYYIIYEKKMIDIPVQDLKIVLNNGRSARTIVNN